MDPKLPDSIKFQREIISKQDLEETFNRYLTETKNPPKVYLYEECRVYGGPEEGGWWYNRSWPVTDTILLPSDWEEAWTCFHSLLETWEEEYTSTDIYSVNGRTAFSYAFCAYNEDPSDMHFNEAMRYE